MRIPSRDPILRARRSIQLQLVPEPLLARSLSQLRRYQPCTVLAACQALDKTVRRFNLGTPVAHNNCELFPDAGRMALARVFQITRRTVGGICRHWTPSID